MKRKFIRTLLFGALIGLQATAFVSCKDYDDDIAALRSEITTNATDLKSLVDEKMKNVEAELSALKSQSSALEEAYKKADKVLEDAIATATNDAKGYADVQAAEAQKAAVASAKTMVDNAVAKLEASLDAANKKIDENGNNIASLIAANVTLTEGVQAAQKRADEAYALAETAKKLADAAQAAAEAAQAAADKAQGSADAANEAAAANAKLIGELKTALEGITTEMGEVKATLGTMAEQISTLEGEFTAKIAELEATLAEYESQAAKLTDLEDSYNKLAEMISAGDAELKGLADANKAEIDALKQTLDNFKAEAVESALTDAKEYTEAQIGVLQAEIVSQIASANEALSTSFATELATLKTDLETLIGLNASGVAANKEEIEKLAGKIGENATAIADNATAIGNNASAIAAANTKISAVETAYKAADDAIKGLITALTTRVATLEGKVSTLEAQLSKINPYLEDNLNSLITGITVQDQKLQFVYSQVDVSAGDVVNNHKYAEVVDNQTVVTFPYIGAANAQSDLVTGQYNVEKIGGLVYFTINPNNVNFEDGKANVAMENSLGNAPETATGRITIGAPQSAEGHLITTRAAAANGLYAAQLTHENLDKTKAPENFENSYALYTAYKTTDKEGNRTEKRVYSKYEVNVSCVKASYSKNFKPFMQIKAKGEDENKPAFGDVRFTSKAGEPMVGAFELILQNTTDGIASVSHKVFRKYVEVNAVWDSRNQPVTGDALNAIIADVVNANSSVLNQVMEEDHAGFDAISVTIPSQYKGYTFQFQYYAQYYNGKVYTKSIKAMFAQPLFDGGVISLTHTPASAAEQTTGKVGLGECLANMTLWSSNAKTIEVDGAADLISDIKIYDKDDNLKAFASDNGTAWVFDNLSKDLVSTFAQLAIVYDPAKLVVDKEYTFTLNTYDTNHNLVCKQDVKFTMTHPTACNGLISPNPAYFDGELTGDPLYLDGQTLYAWAYFKTNNEKTYGYYNVSSAFNKLSDEHGCALRFEIAADSKASYKGDGANAAYSPICLSDFSWVGSSYTDYVIEVPAAAVKYGSEHVYPMAVAVQYYGVTSLWAAPQPFKLVFRSAIAYADFKFDKASYDIGYPTQTLKITDSNIKSDDPATSKVDDIMYFGTSRDPRIADVKVELVDKQYESLFKKYEVTANGIEIETSEAIEGGVASINANNIQFRMIVTDQFSNPITYDFKVNVKANN